jgi:hypothetical protein
MAAGHFETFARSWLILTVPIVAAVAAASAAGAFTAGAYGKETASWSAQGVGQDLANLAVVLPAFLISAYLAVRGSLPAFLIWQGILIYLVYSYVLYAFYVHFGALFLVYVAALGLSFYALAGSVLSSNTVELAAHLDRGRRAGHMSALLMTVGIVFTLLWLSEIVPALARGTAPPSAIEVGFPVNPIHVLDLAFLLPALVLTALLLRRRHVYGLIFAVPLATFLIAMGLAIFAMVFVMRARGVTVSLVMPIVVAGIVVLTAYLTTAYLRDVS